MANKKQRLTSKHLGKEGDLFRTKFVCGPHPPNKFLEENKSSLLGKLAFRDYREVGVTRHYRCGYCPRELL